MATCPFCGNAINEFDCICGRCGQDLSDLTILLLVNEAGYEQSKYGKYDSALDTSINKKVYKNRHRGTDIFKKLLVIAVLTIIAYQGYRKIRDIVIRPYQHIVKIAVASVIECNYDLMISNRIIDYDKMFAKYYGDWYLGVQQLYRSQNQKCIRSMREKYGDNYKIAVKINSVADMEGELKDEAIERAINTQNEEFRLNELDTDFRLYDRELNCRAYLDRGSIKKVKRLKVTATIKGPKDRRELNYVVDIAKIKERSNWKILYVYEDEH